MKFKELESKPNFSQIQPEVLKFWEENHIFEKSLKDKKGETVFYDGPPFPTGKPHHGTVLVSFIKDMIARYWTMRGTSVPRVWGWDCHGLPIENLAEKTLGIEDKSVIEKSFNFMYNKVAVKKLLKQVLYIKENANDYQQVCSFLDRRDGCHHKA